MDSYRDLDDIAYWIQPEGEVKHKQSKDWMPTDDLDKEELPGYQEGD